MNALLVKEVQVSFGTQTIIKELTFECGVGCLAILGTTGAGKSTAGRAITRMLSADDGWRVEGDAILGGKSMKETSAEAWRRQCVLVPQRPTAFPGTVRWNVEFALRWFRLGTRDEIAEKARLALEVVGLSGLEGKWASALSGGQTQRLTIARAIALEPPVLLLDEPTASQDPVASKQLSKLVLQIAQARTVIVVTHNLRWAETVANQVVFLHNDGGGSTVNAQGAIGLLRNPTTPQLATFVEELVSPVHRPPASGPEELPPADTNDTSN